MFYLRGLLIIFNKPNLAMTKKIFPKILWNKNDLNKYIQITKKYKMINKLFNIKCQILAIMFCNFCFFHSAVKDGFKDEIWNLNLFNNYITVIWRIPHTCWLLSCLTTGWRISSVFLLLQPKRLKQNLKFRLRNTHNRQVDILSSSKQWKDILWSHPVGGAPNWRSCRTDQRRVLNTPEQRRGWENRTEASRPSVSSSPLCPGGQPWGAYSPELVTTTDCKDVEKKCYKTTFFNPFWFLRKPKKQTKLHTPKLFQGLQTWSRKLVQDLHSSHVADSWHSLCVVAPKEVSQVYHFSSVQT